MGIWLNRGIDAVVMNNSILGNTSWCLYVSGESSIISANSIGGDTYTWVDPIDGTTHTGIRRTQRCLGISAGYPDNGNNTITGNLVTLCNIGLQNDGNSTSNSVTKNTFSDNNEALYIIQPDNTFYNNNFINNGNVGYVSTANLFNNNAPLGGNYWSNFDSSEEGCINADGDNFCDQPFAISDTVADNLPWTTQDGWLK